MKSQLSYLWKEPGAARGYRAAVSLHGHTNRSKEGLYFIRDFANRHAFLREALAKKARHAQKIRGITLDFDRAYWTPPLAPLAAYRLERDQIERVLRLAAMVSLSDHDNIEAPLLLHILPEAREVPISLEWTLPYQDAELHIGVHNLPPARAEAIMTQFADYTNNPRPAELADIFKMLHGLPDALVILNHPMWDLAHIGKQRHVHVLHDFVASLGMYIHAFELGGVRTWEENQEVIDFAEKWDQVVIGGGDRHGAEPSAVVNLTNAASFSEFVHEVRQKRRCHVLFMPQYSEPWILRIFLSVLDVIRAYPDFPEGSRQWDERAFHPDREGVMRPLAALWAKRPWPAVAFFAALRWLESAPLRKLMQIALAKPRHEMQFVPGRGREVVSQWKQVYGSRSFQTPTMKSMEWRTPAGNLRRSPEDADSPS